jgi:hypothetical protein
MIQSYLSSSRVGILQILDVQCYHFYVTTQSFCASQLWQLKYYIETFVFQVFKAFDTVGNSNKFHIKPFKHTVSISHRAHYIPTKTISRLILFDVRMLCNVITVCGVKLRTSYSAAEDPYSNHSAFNVKMMSIAENLIIVLCTKVTNLEVRVL